MTFASAVSSSRSPPIPESTQPASAEGPPIAADAFSTAQTLITTYDRCWDPISRIYKHIPFDQAEFIRVATAHHVAFPPTHNPDTEFGHIEKKVVNPGSKIFVRADLHGDLKSLVENLKALQEQDLLDENFRCRPNVHLVFLGDYVDRGPHSMQVLQLLLILRMENPVQVTLICGNHESTDINTSFCGADLYFRDFLYEPSTFQLCTAHTDLLTQIYRTMPLCAYFAEQVSSGELQYVMFTHGAFELHVDPFDLLAKASTIKTMTVPKIPVGQKSADLLSERVRTLVPSEARDFEKELQEEGDKAARKQIKQQWAARRIHTLAMTHRCEIGITAYNWGDMQNPGLNSVLFMLGNRSWKFSAADVKHYLCLSSSPGSHAVKFVFRGHQHETRHHSHHEDIVVTTMPIGMDVGTYSREYRELDTGYILTTAPIVNPKIVDSEVVAGWTKQAMLRPPGDTGMRIESPCSIQSTRV